MSLTREKGLKQHDLTPFFRIPITVIRVDAVLLRDVKGCCCNAGGIGQGGAQIFAVGGNGSGIAYFRALQKLGIPFAAGILFENDIDFRVARALANTVVGARAFEPMGKAERDAAAALIDRVDFVADCGCPFGTLNRANQTLLEYAAARGKRMITSIEQLSEIGGHR